MRKALFAASTIMALGIVSSAPASAEILKKGPPKGGLATGQVVYVDNGKCGPGRIAKQVGGVGVGSRTKTCVPRSEALGR